MSEEPHVFPHTRKRGELLFCTLILLFAGLLLAAVPWQTTWLAGKGLAAQPRTWPTVALAGMVTFAGLNWLRRSRAARTPGRWREGLVWLRSIEFIGWYLLYVKAIPILGYLPATLAFCTGLTFRLGYRSRRALLAAPVFGLAVVLTFKTALNVKIPGGALYELAPEALRYILLRYF